MRKSVAHAKAFADGARRPDRLVGQYRHVARGAVGHAAESGERVQDAVVGAGEVQLVLAIVSEEEAVRGGQFLVVNLIGRNAVLDRQRPPHQHRRAIADKAGDDVVAEAGPSHMLERRIDAVAQIPCRVDEGSIEIEHHELDALDGDGAEDADHASSVKDREQGSGNRDQGSEVRAGCVNQSFARASTPRILTE